ncbi:hypothetical protein CDD83_2820 [Cordyceps sp. RAO-2017]|nr:hypothetical protein CDD83_2820 [Cordyceps sp. RAO-2017]
MFFETRQLDFVTGVIIRPIGPLFWPPVHDIFKPGFRNGRSNTFFLRRLLELQKTEQLRKYLPRLLRDVRNGCEALADCLDGVVIPSECCWDTVFKQDCRLFCTDEIADDPKLLRAFSDLVLTLLHTFSHYNMAFPRLPSPSWAKRRYCRYTFVRLLKQIIKRRMIKGGASVADPLQVLIDYGDSVDYMVEFFMSALFIAPANSRIMTGQMLNIMSIHTDWQEKIYSEIKTAVRAHSKNPDAALVEQLDSLSLEVWESSFPTIQLCLREAVRMWTSFSMARLNMSSDPIPIPGTDEVIPGNTFVCYNSTEVNFSEQLYPDPAKFDPARFLEGREEFKKETYGFVGWGQGCHPCAGVRWAKIQQNMIFAYALAMYRWTSCDEEGRPTPNAVHEKLLNTKRSTVLPKAFCKVVPRQEMRG